MTRSRSGQRGWAGSSAITAGGRVLVGSPHGPRHAYATNLARAAVDAHVLRDPNELPTRSNSGTSLGRSAHSVSNLDPLTSSQEGQEVPMSP